MENGAGKSANKVFGKREKDAEWPHLRHLVSPVGGDERMHEEWPLKQTTPTSE